MIRRPLADLLPAAADLLGVPSYAHAGDWLADPLHGARHVVVALIDGLGDRQLNGHAQLAEALTSQFVDLGGLAAPFPSTTPVSLTCLGTGLPPGQHGIVSIRFRLDDGSTLTPLGWTTDPNPIATQPEPTVFEQAQSAGVLVTSVGPAQFESSGLTRAGLRGGRYVGVDTIPQRAAAVAATIAEARRIGCPSLTYVYWPDLDKAGHVFGVDSSQWRTELARVDALVARLAAALDGPDAALLVTADHGMLDVADASRLALEAAPRLRSGVSAIMGEPRERQIYCEPGQAAAVAATWAQVLGDRAQVRRREEVAELLGPVDEWYVDRLGDVVAIANDAWSLYSERVDWLVSSLRGQHGGVTPDEVEIPLRLHRGS